MNSGIQEEEQVIGRPDINPDLESGRRSFNNRYRCSNCRRPKGPIHCYVEGGEPVVLCTDKICQCPCRKKYECLQCGNLHFYGNSCVRVEPKPVPNEKADKKIREINDSWNKLQAQKKQNMPQIKHD